MDQRILDGLGRCWRRGAPFRVSRPRAGIGKRGVEPRKRDSSRWKRDGNGGVCPREIRKRVPRGRNPGGNSGVAGKGNKEADFRAPSMGGAPTLVEGEAVAMGPFRKVQ